MISFAILSPDGKVLRAGRCEKSDLRLQRKAGEILAVGTYALDDIVDTETGEIVGKASPAARPDDLAPEFVKARRHSYPAVTEQLDMLWHAMDRGEIPKAEEWFSRIAAVKAAHPKAPGDAGFEEIG